MYDLKEDKFTDKLDQSQYDQVIVDKDYISSGNYFSKYFGNDDIVAKDTGIKELVKKYRRYAQFPKVSKAVTIISNGMIISENGESVVDISLSKILDYNDKNYNKIAKKIPELFEEIKKLLKFDMYGVDHVKQWYVDGGIYVYFELKKGEGIKKIRVLDRLKLTLVKKNNKIYYEYKIDGVKKPEELSYDNVLFIPSGLMDPDTNTNIGYLNKAIRPINLLNMLENSLVVYRFVRAPERYVFQIDVSSKNKKKGQQYIKNMQNKYKSKFTIDTLTGEMNSSNMTMAMQENFWFAKTNSQNGGHSIDSIGGNSPSFGDLDDIKYFKEEAMDSLHVPISRLREDASFTFGSRVEEISRDENDFQEFKNYLRKRFSVLFTKLIKIHGNSKNIFMKDEFEELEDDIRYKYKNDSIYYEAKKRAKLEAKLEMATQYKDIALEWWDEDFFRSEILGQTEDEIKKYKKSRDEFLKNKPEEEME